MARNRKTETPDTTNDDGQPQESQGAGRPPGSKTRPADVTALETLQSRLNRSTALVNDDPTASIATAVARCAKVGVPKEKALAALAGLKAAVQDLEASIEAVYAAPASRVTSAKPRVVLAE